ncbi:MAG: C25 family cysteine peptidase [bacterium]
MRKITLILLSLVSVCLMQAQVVEKTYFFGKPELLQIDAFQTISFEHTQLTGLPGEPVLPYHAISLILPPGHVAKFMELIGEQETQVPGTFILYPQQHVSPLSKGKSGDFIQNTEVYRRNAPYPVKNTGQLFTQFLNGYSLALSSFTPVSYNPATGTLSYFKKVTVRMLTEPGMQAGEALKNLSSLPTVLNRVRMVAENPEALADYPKKPSLKTVYDMLIITTQTFSNSFQDLINMYQSNGISCQVATTQTISATMTGQDLQEKIRNYIIQEYQNNSTSYVLLGGDAELVPYRGFYCQVQSSSLYEDFNIPADLYYSALDGNWNTNGNNLWGEPGEDDLLPDIGVTRYPFSTEGELQNMMHKSISYQTNPVLGELQQPFLVAEYLYEAPMTFGGPYLDLLIDDHTDNGYFTHGIPSAENTIVKLYDTLISLPNNIFSWDVTTLLEEINQGKSFIHHVGHSNETYMMRLFIWDITNTNFSEVNGVDHNYTLMYTHGCLCGAFDVNDCIAEKAVTIENFLAGGVFNSRYGWFNEGQTEGPSAHLNREFVSALYNDTLAFKRFGETHMVSKIKTAPWVTAPGQWEPGALRWCDYCCNVFGDPAMEIWTDEPTIGIPEVISGSPIRIYPNPAHEQVVLACQIDRPGTVYASLINGLGQIVAKWTFPDQQAGASSLSINVSQFSTGIYTLTVESAGNYNYGKLIIRK